MYNNAMANEKRTIAKTENNSAARLEKEVLLKGAKTSGLSYTVAACAVFFVSLVIVLAVAAAGVDTENPPQWYLYLNFLAAPIGFACVGAWYFWYAKKPFKQFFKEESCSPKYYLIALLMQTGLLSLGELNTLFLTFLEKFGYENPEITLPSLEGFGFFGVLLTVAVIPAVMEEFFFRGILLKGTKGFPVWGRVLLCGGLFALYHQNPAQTIYQFLCGVAFALVAVKAGSFLPTVLSHFFNNALVVVLYKCEIYSYPKPVYIVLLIASVISLAASLVYLLAFDRKKEEVKAEKAAYKSFFLFAALGIATFALSWVAVLISGLM